MADFDLDFRFPSTPHNQDRMASPYSLPLRPPPGSFAREAWQDLNEELTQNVEREFPPFQDDVGSVFEEDFHSTTSLLPRSSPRGGNTCSIKDEKFEPESSSRAPRVKVELDEDGFEKPGASNAGYMGRASPFSLDFPRSEMSFIEYYPKGDATITYPMENGDVESISGLHPWAMEERCPILALAFEEGSRSGPQLHLETLTPSTAKPFIRYLYTGSYALPGPHGDLYEDVPTSLLLHCQLYRLGDIYDLVDLKQQANVNVTRQCEFGCSSPDKPIDLCAAINYVYEHLQEHPGLIETIICYCVTCFLRHHLEDHAEFRSMAYFLRKFNQDLARESMKRDFEDEAAAAIIRMPFEPYVPETYASREDNRANRFDVVYHFHGIDDADESSKGKRPAIAGNALSALLHAQRLNREKKREQTGDDESTPADESASPGSKRKASPVPESVDTAEGLSSDSEFEVIPGPAPVEELSSDSDSDADTLVVVDRPGAVSGSQEHSLPIRRRPSVASSMTLVEPEPAVAAAAAEQSSADSGSESEWSLV